MTPAKVLVRVPGVAARVRRVAVLDVGRADEDEAVGALAADEARRAQRRARVDGA